MTQLKINENDDLAERLKTSSTPPPKAPVAYKAGLRARLLSQYNTLPARPARLWLTVSILVGLAVLGLTFVLLWSPLGIWPASAAEILQHANTALAAQTEGAALIYDRFVLDIQTGMVVQEGAAIELWHSPDGQQFRYQLTAADGSLLYFVQRSGDRFWRSFHNLPVGAEPVRQIYQLSLDQYRQSNLPDAFEGQNISDMTIGWLDINGEHGKACTDLFCLLGITGEEWQCQGKTCTQFRDGQPIAEALLLDDEQLADGQTVHVIEIHPSLGLDWRRVTQIDARTLALVEVADFDRGNLVDRLRLIERQALAATDIPNDFYSTFPAGIELVDMQAVPEPTPVSRTNRMWIISVSPEPGTAVDEQTEFVVEVGYDLVTLPEASLQVMLWPAFNWFGGSTENSDPVNITQGEGTVTVRFRVEPRSLDSGQWMLQTSLGTFSGNQLIFLATTDWSEYQWCILCGEKVTP